ncbi:MAG: peptidoglycan D,D-transpeptidase FtsI family protein [Bdellovibrionales bacterium]
MKSRVLFLFSFFLLLWSLLLVRAMYLQVFPDHRLENLKRRQFETTLQIRTRRGAILDRHGKELAASVPAYSLFADPKLIQDPHRIADKLAKKLRISKSSLVRRLKNQERRFVWIRRQLDRDQRNEIRKWREPGLGFIEEPRRVYPNGQLLSQVLGFVGSEGDGLEGLELQFDKILQGRLKSVLLPRDARGRPLLEDGRALTEVPDGADLELTIDHEVQFTLERELASVIKKFRADSAVGIVMDAVSSEILAMANLPMVDANDGMRSKPTLRRNRIVTDGFEPGSTMKTFVIAAGLREALLKPSSRFFCENGKLKVGDKWISEADQDHKFGWLTATEILAHSSNVGTAKIAFEVGDEKIYRTLTDFGFGGKVGIELPGEGRGIVQPLPWRPHLLSNISFGHGVAVTPLQIATAYTAIANGGVLKRPVLVRAIHRPDQREPETFSAVEVRRVLSPADAATLRLMLTAATEEHGTGVNARIPGYFVAGKTGTAQKVDFKKGGYVNGQYISSFAGFVPAHSPRFVIYVAVDNPRESYYGSQVAAPIFAKVAQFLVRRAGLPPVMISEANVISTKNRKEKERTELQSQAISELRHEISEEASPELPSFHGLTLREALTQVRRLGFKVEVHGHGVVVRTVPSAASEIQRKKYVRLILENPD